MSYGLPIQMASITREYHPIHIPRRPRRWDSTSGSVQLLDAIQEPEADDRTPLTYQVRVSYSAVGKLWALLAVLTATRYTQ